MMQLWTLFASARVIACLRMRFHLPVPVREMGSPLRMLGWASRVRGRWCARGAWLAVLCGPSCGGALPLLRGLLFAGGGPLLRGGRCLVAGACRSRGGLRSDGGLARAGVRVYHPGHDYIN